MILPELVHDLAVIVRGTLAYRFLFHWRTRGEPVSRTPEGTRMTMQLAGALLVLDDEDGERLFAWGRVWGDA